MRRRARLKPRTIGLLAFTALLSLALCSGQAPAATQTWTGTLTWDATIVATPDWNQPGTSLTWTVTWHDFAEPSWAGWYRYQYDWTNASGGSLSHFIIEVSDDAENGLPAFDMANSMDFSGPAYNGHAPGEIEVGYFGAGTDNPNIPATFYGLKFGTDDEANSETVSFYSRRVPVWGDFYAKDGDSSSGTDTDPWLDFSTAWNTGFIQDDSDPSIDVYPIKIIVDGKYNSTDTEGWGHVAVPDSEYSVPEPATWLLLLSTAAAGAMARRRKKRD